MYKVGRASDQLAPPIRNYMDLPSWRSLEKLLACFDAVESKEALAQASKDFGNAQKPVKALQAAVTAMVSSLVSARDQHRKKEKEIGKKRVADDGQKTGVKRRNLTTDIFELVVDAPLLAPLKNNWKDTYCVHVCVTTATLLHWGHRNIIHIDGVDAGCVLPLCLLSEVPAVPHCEDVKKWRGVAWASISETPLLIPAASLPDEFAVAAKDFADDTAGGQMLLKGADMMSQEVTRTRTPQVGTLDVQDCPEPSKCVASIVVGHFGCHMWSNLGGWTETEAQTLSFA